jgi:uncharacterized membrane protein
MNKYEFITNLQRHLTGKVSPQKLQELTRYYSDYIDTEIRKGKSEEEVLRMLGDPRLLAKTIAETEGKESAWGGEDGRNGYTEDVYRDEARRGVHVDVRALLFWIAVIVVLCLVLSVVFKVVGVVLQIFVHYILPILIPIALIYLLISLLRR